VLVLSLATIIRFVFELLGQSSDFGVVFRFLLEESVYGSLV